MIRVVTITQLVHWEEIAKYQKLPVVKDSHEALAAKQSVFVEYPCDIPQLQSLLQTDGKVVVVYPSPVEMLEHSLQQGVSLKQAKKDCFGLMMELAEEFKCNREKLTLLNSADLALLEDKLDTRMQSLGWPMDGIALKSPNSLLAPICELVLTVDEELENARQILSASSKFVCEEQLDINLENTISSYWADKKIIEKIDHIENKADEVEQQNTLLLHQIMNLQEELERYYFEDKKKVRLIEELRKELSKYEPLGYDKNRFSPEIKKTANYQVRQLQNQISLKTKQIEILQKELNSVHNSIVWKAAAPFRAISNFLFKKGSDRNKEKEDITLLNSSDYFDAKWYLRRYSDVSESGMSPAKHYLLFGGNEGRMPSQKFDSKWYLKKYPDVAAANINPLLHFIKFGQAEGRAASPIKLNEQSSLVKE